MIFFDVLKAGVGGSVAVAGDSKADSSRHPNVTHGQEDSMKQPNVHIARESPQCHLKLP